MLRFFQVIPFEPRIKRISALKRISIRPVRDYLWVETMDSPTAHRAVRYGICKNPDMDTNHMAYLRHAVLGWGSAFYRYVVPTEQLLSAKFQYLCKSLIQRTNDIIKAYRRNLSINSILSEKTVFTIKLG